jgi:acetyl esterase/lipase
MGIGYGFIAPGPARDNFNLAWRQMLAFRHGVAQDGSMHDVSRPAWFAFRGTVFAVLALVLLAPAGASERAPFVTVHDPAAPKAPPGYTNSAMVLAAIALKQVKIVPLSPLVPPEVTETKALEYGNVRGRALHLDLFRPAKTDQPAPAVIFIHGGAWSGGNREQLRLYAIDFAKRGYVTAAISYRLSREAPFPAAVEDAKCAVRWLRAQAREHGVDPDRIAVAGNSAGGHLAMMLGYAPDKPELEGDGGHAGVSSRVQAVINIYGPYDLTADIARENGAVRRFLQGKTLDEAPELHRLASPRFHLAKGAPPTLILHGTIDDVVPIAQSDALAARLQALGVPYLYDRLEGWPHAMDAAEAINLRCQYFMERFLKEHLAPRPHAGPAH